MSEPILLYGGEVKLRFDKQEHRYTVSDVRVHKGKPFLVPSVTQFLKVIDKPGLKWWASRCAVDSVREAWLPGVAYPQEAIDVAMYKAYRAHDAERKRGSDVGTMAHDWIEEFFRGKAPALPSDLDARRSCESQQDWLVRNHVEILFFERKVYSRKYKYAGTADLGARVNGILSVCDWKTANGIYGDNFLQAALYEQAVEEEDGIQFEKRHIVRLGKFDGKFMVLSAGQDTFKKDLAAGLAARKLAPRIEELGKWIKAQNEQLKPNNGSLRDSNRRTTQGKAEEI